MFMFIHVTFDFLDFTYLYTLSQHTKNAVIWDDLNVIEQK